MMGWSYLKQKLSEYLKKIPNLVASKLICMSSPQKYADDKLKNIYLSLL